MGDSYEKKTDFTDDMLSGCGSDGVTREEYESVIAERDSYREQVEEYEKEKSESLEKAVEELSIMDEMSFAESEVNRHRILSITMHHGYTDMKWKDFGDVLERVRKEPWFDYEYVFIEIWNSSLGLVTSMELNMRTEDIRSHIWYDVSGEDSNGDSGTLIYQNEDVIITYTGMSGYSNYYYINLEVENLTDETLLIQTEETSINGYMVDPLYSVDISPGKKAANGMMIWSNDAKAYPLESVETVETKFRIMNDDYSIRSVTELVTVYQKE